MTSFYFLTLYLFLFLKVMKVHYCGIFHLLFVRIETQQNTLTKSLIHRYKSLPNYNFRFGETWKGEKGLFERGQNLFLIESNKINLIAIIGGWWLRRYKLFAVYTYMY